MLQVTWLFVTKCSALLKQIVFCNCILSKVVYGITLVKPIGKCSSRTSSKLDFGCFDPTCTWWPLCAPSSLSLFLSLLWATFSEANSRNFISLHDSFCTYSTEPSGGNAVNLFSNISPRAKLIQILYGDIGIKQKRTLHEWVGRIANYVELQ